MERYWYPLKLTTPIRTYAFGERLIPERLGKTGLPDGRVAETWEVSDYRDARATITNGPFAGRTLHESVDFHPDLVGAGWQGPHFPLLAKFLDASHMLPVHLHADDETARRLHGELNGKSEAWHILWAEPGASILAGIKPGFSHDELVSAFKAGDFDRVMPRYPISEGDTVYVPGGVLHSFGPGTLIFEIQQTSDLGQFVTPWDLFGNRLSDEQWDANIEAALAELRMDFLPRSNPGLALTRGENRYNIGCAGPYFALERWLLLEPHYQPAHPERCLTISNIGEPVTITFGGREERLERAESCVIPAVMGDYTIQFDSRAELIVCYPPNLDEHVIAPLREAGYSDDQISSLGEVFSTQ
jgi:mannose-6-phosphate isomerase